MNSDTSVRSSGVKSTLLSQEAPKSADFRALDCLGYFMDDFLARYGYILKCLPGAVARQPRSLHDLYNGTGRSERDSDRSRRSFYHRTRSCCIDAAIT